MSDRYENSGYEEGRKCWITKRMLFSDIQKHGTFTADFKCEDRNCMDVRVQTADYDGKKYFIVQMGGEVVTVKEI